MAKVFNVTGSCIPRKHYMADMTKRIRQIQKLVDAGLYFTIFIGIIEDIQIPCL